MSLVYPCGIGVSPVTDDLIYGRDARATEMDVDSESKGFISLVVSRGERNVLWAVSQLAWTSERRR